MRLALVVLTVTAGMVLLAGCSSESAVPIVDNSTTQAHVNRLAQMQNDPSIPAAEKQAYAAQFGIDNTGLLSHAPPHIHDKKK